MHNDMTRIARIVLFGGILAFACSRTQPLAWTPAATGETWIWAGGATADGKVLAPVKGVAVTLEVAGEAVSGSSGCNRYNGRISFSGDSVAIGPLATTRMACMEPEGLMAQEQMYVGMLAQRWAASLKGNALVLKGKGGEMRFELAGSDREKGR
jgi:heat shock protein HslJ